MIQWIAVGAIVACAVAYLAYRLLRRGKDSCADCPVSPFCSKNNKNRRR